MADFGTCRLEIVICLAKPKTSIVLSLLIKFFYCLFGVLQYSNNRKKNFSKSINQIRAEFVFRKEHLTELANNLIIDYLYPLVYTVRLVEGNPPSKPSLVVSTISVASHGVPLGASSHKVCVTLLRSHLPDLES